MKVIGIVGSPRKNGNTELLTKHTLKAISEDGLDTELLRLPGLEIKPCNACMACKEQEICSIKDDLWYNSSLTGILWLCYGADYQLLLV